VFGGEVGGQTELGKDMTMMGLPRRFNCEKMCSRSRIIRTPGGDT
jgi:hypothetical protein